MGWKKCVDISLGLRILNEGIAAMKLPWDWEMSYALTLKHSDISAGPDNKKYSDKEKQLLQIAETLPGGKDKDKMMEILTNRDFFHIEFDNIFREHNRKIGWGRSVANLNPKHTGTSLYRGNEAFSGEILLAIYRHHSDVLFYPELKTSLSSFMNFHQALRYHNWPLTLPVYAGQEERYAEIAPLYRKMAEWVEKKAEDEDFN